MTPVVDVSGLVVARATACSARRPSAQVPIGDPEDDEGGIGYDDEDDEDDDDDHDGEEDEE
jgi:hypothetical protein